MHIELKGEVTAERIRNAIETAAEHLGDNFGGFAGASLFLTAYSKQGVEMDLSRDGKKIILFFNEPANTGKPEVTTIVDRRTRSEAPKNGERRGK